MAENLKPPSSQSSLPPEGAALDVLKADVKKLNAKATQAKMDLHDLSEELPTNWERIPEVAKIAHEAHAALIAARKALSDAQAGVAS